MGRPRGPSLAERTERTETCWLWTGPVNNSGYGSVRVNDRIVGAHVAAYLATGQTVPTGMEVRHSCDNRICVNPQHLLVGTKLDNMQDAVERGRTARGERNATAQLTSADVLSIRSRVADGENIAEIARSLSRPYMTVYQAAKGLRWGWL